MEEKKRKTGRPPANWMYQISKINAEEIKMITNEDIANRCHITVNALKKFCSRLDLEIDYRRENGTIKSYYDFRKFQKAVRDYIKERENG